MFPKQPSAADSGQDSHSPRCQCSVDFELPSIRALKNHYNNVCSIAFRGRAKSTSILFGFFCI